MADEIIDSKPLDHVRLGWRVKHFRPQKNGEFLHGTVVGIDYPKWCRVKWDNKHTGPVMIECLLASDKP